jgi:hypothetical protein
MSTAFKFGGTGTEGSTALATFGPVNVINDYLSTANRRGKNFTIPFRHGTVFVQKFYDEREMTFGITCTTASAGALETSLNTMRALFAPLTQQTLSMTMEDATIRNVLATVDKTIGIARLTPSVAKVTIEFRLTSPFWRLSTAIADNTTTINSSPKAMTVTNPGTVQERDPFIRIDGPFSTITINNSTNGTWVSYNGAITGAQYVIIQTVSGEYTATLHAAGTNVIGKVAHGGSASLLPIEVGANTLSILSTGGDNTGTVKIYFNAPFL